MVPCLKLSCLVYKRRFGISIFGTKSFLLGSSVLFLTPTPTLALIFLETFWVKTVPIADDETVVEKARTMMLEQQSEDVDDALRLAHESIQKAVYEGKNERARAVLAMLKEGQDSSVQCKFPLQNATSEVVRMSPLVIAARFVCFRSFFLLEIDGRCMIQRLFRGSEVKRLFGGSQLLPFPPFHRLGFSDSRTCKCSRWSSTTTETQATEARPL